MRPSTCRCSDARRAGGVLDVRLHDPRAYTTDQHHSVDDAPFGGGAGMVMMPEPLFAAVEAAQPPRPLLLLSASGRRFDQARARELAAGPGFSLICGRYEGVDQRVADHLCDGELSVGDFVLSGGEGAALIVIDAVARLLPGVMGNEASAGEESFTTTGSNTRSTRARPSSGAGPCPTCCDRAITAGSPAGGPRRRCAGPSSAGPIWSGAS